MGDVINPATGTTSQSFIISGTHSITTEKLIGSANYLSCSVKMWFKGQGQVNHLTKKVTDIVESERAKWEQIDAQLCNLLWQSIDSSIIQLFRPFETCYDVWTEASECYTNDIQRLYTVVSNIQNMKQEGNMESYLGHVRALMQEFEALMPYTSSRAEQTAQKEKFFMVAALSGLKPEYESARHQILTSSTTPTMKDTFRRLLNMTGTNVVNSSTTPPPSAFVTGTKRDQTTNDPTVSIVENLVILRTNVGKSMAGQQHRLMFFNPILKLLQGLKLCTCPPLSMKLISNIRMLNMLFLLQLVSLKIHLHVLLVANHQTRGL